MKITFEVDENFVEYFTDGGITRKEVQQFVKEFIEEVLLKEFYSDNDLIFMSRFEDFLADKLD
jgi:hypothetical protein